jgi:hypothetical protein
MAELIEKRNSITCDKDYQRHRQVKLSLRQAVEAHKVETSRLPHFLDNRLTDFVFKR